MRFHFRRASDLIPSAIDKSRIPLIKQLNGPSDAADLVKNLEEEAFTGCLKITCPERRSRSAALLYQGRVMGCIYGCAADGEPQPTDVSLREMLDDCTLAGTQAVRYTLPEEVVLGMAALFLGLPIERTDTMDAGAYLVFIMPWLFETSETACLVFFLPKSESTTLLLVHQGMFVGTFEAETQRFSTSLKPLLDQLAKDDEAHVEASILPRRAPGIIMGYGLTAGRS